MERDLYHDVYYYKGETHLKVGQFQEAIDCANKVLEVKPQFAQAIILKSLALDNIGNSQEALRVLENALEFNLPAYDLDNIRLFKAELCLRLQKFEEVKKVLEELKGSMSADANHLKDLQQRLEIAQQVGYF